MVDLLDFTASDELEIHLEAMNWFESRRINGDKLITFDELKRGFNWGGYNFPLISRAQGIWKPKGLSAALTFKTTAPKPGHNVPYQDLIEEDGTIHYKMAATRDKEWTNQAMSLAADRGYPLAWLVGIRPEVNRIYYYARFPAFITDVDWSGREFLISIGGGPGLPMPSQK